MPEGDVAIATQTFQCGYCGAITEGPKPERQKKGRCARLGARLGLSSAAVMRRSRVPLISFVVILVSSIIVVGFYVFPPLVWSSPLSSALHSLLSAALSFFVLFHYYAVVTTSPGRPCDVLPRPAFSPQRPLEPPPDPADRCGRAAYPFHRYCRHCDAHKPPSAHHCKVCGECTMDLDHHCPWVGACVGRYNLRVFLLFLGSATAGCLYVQYHCAWVWLQYGHEFTDHVSRTRRVHQMLTAGIPDHHPGFSLRHVGKGFHGFFWVLARSLLGEGAPWWTLPLLFEFVASLLVALMVGGLLASQLAQLLRGETYIDALQRVSGGNPFAAAQQPVPGQAWRALREVFGDGPPWQWVLVPRRGAPRGSLAARTLELQKAR